MGRIEFALAVDGDVHHGPRRLVPSDEAVYRLRHLERPHPLPQVNPEIRY